jgi:DHA2 family methylenomycin A resistance protein-like MFS transporter
MAAGPLIGGALTQWLGWRSIFFVNLPLGVCGVALAWRLLADPQPQLAVRFDWPGQFAAMVALAALIGVLIEGQTLGWTSPLILSGAAIALVAGLGFVWIEARSPHAMLPLALFRQPIFAGSTLVSALSALVFYGLFFVASLEFQQVRGYSPLHAGLAFVPLTAMVALASLLSHRVVRAYGQHVPMCAAFVLYAAGALGLMLTPPLLNLLSMIAIGLASGFISPAATAPAMEAVAPQAAGVAAATLNAARQTGAALGVAIFGSLVTTLPSFTAGLSAALWAAAGLSLFAALVWGQVMGRTAQPRPQPR